MAHPIETALTADGVRLLDLRPPIYSLNMDAARVSDQVREHGLIEFHLERQAVFLYGSRTSLQLAGTFQNQAAAYAALGKLYDDLAEKARHCSQNATDLQVADHVSRQEREGEEIAARAERETEERHATGGDGLKITVMGPHGSETYWDDEGRVLGGSAVIGPKTDGTEAVAP